MTFFSVALLLTLSVTPSQATRASEAAVSVFICAMTALAAPPQTMNYQGLLKTSAGLPITGTRTLIINIYNVATGGTALWTETHTNVTVTKGQFSLLLGQGSPTPVPLALNFDVPYWLGVKIATEAAEMTPRQPLTTAPYAFGLRLPFTYAAPDANTLFTVNNTGTGPAPPEGAG